MKKVIIIIQHKGGVGKTELAYQLAEKYKRATIVDMDGACHSISYFLAYRKPWDVSCRSKENYIIADLLIPFFEKVQQHENDLFICDAGPILSADLTRYLQSFSSPFLEAVKRYEINLEFFCVVGGDNRGSKGRIKNLTTLEREIKEEDFVWKVNTTSTMEYTASIYTAIGEHIPITVCKNEHLAYSEVDSLILDAFCKERNLPLISFADVAGDTRLLREKMVKVYTDGKGIDGANGICKFILQNAITNLQIHL